MTNVFDVARLAGVSIATVSRVLNGRGPVSKSARERVILAAEELDFRLNPIAQGLRRGHNATIALLVGDIEQGHFSATTKHIQTALVEIGLDLLLYNLGHSQERFCQILDRAVGMHLRGVVIASSDKIQMDAVRPLIEHLESRKVAVITLGQTFKGISIPSVVHDEQLATQKSVEHLLRQGRRDIVYFGRIGSSMIGMQRLGGYKDALRAAGLPIRDELIWDVSFRYPAGREALLNALDAGTRFDGLQAGSDELALGALSALHDRGIRVPDDVAVIGFGDVQWSEFVRPSLTTLSSHPELEAARLVEILKSLDSEKELPHQDPIRRSLITRQSA